VTLVLAPGGEIVGRVVDAASDEPAPGVVLTASSPHADTQMPGAAVSDAEGEFRILGLAGGGWYQVNAKSDQWRGDEQWVNLGVGQSSEPLVLRVRAATLLTGSVKRAGEPCPEAMVTASGPAADAAYSSETGAVRLEGLLPGSYRINVYCSQALPYSEEIEVGSSPVVREWDVESGLSVSGKVEGPSGTPEPNVVVSITPVGEAADRPPSNCTTDGDGQFTCAGLLPGDHDCFVADTSSSDVVHVSLENGSSPPPVLLRTRPSGVIRVSVASDRGENDRAFKVFARGGDGFAMEGTPRDERFVFERVPLGRYEVYADLPSPRAPIMANLLRAGEVVDVEVMAVRKMSIDGRAVDERGGVVAEAWVSVSPTDAVARTPSATYPPTLTDEYGVFTVAGLAPGDFDLQVRTSSGEGERRAVAAGSTGVVIRVHQQSELTATLGPEP
jgi:hypothetical protein